MSDLYALCQRCGQLDNHWTLRQSEFLVGRVQHWKVQLCVACTQVVEAALISVLHVDEFNPKGDP